MNLGGGHVAIGECQRLFQALRHRFICSHVPSPYLATSVLLISTAAACSALDRLAFSFLAKTVIRKIGIWFPPNTYNVLKPPLLPPPTLGMRILQSPPPRETPSLGLGPVDNHLDAMSAATRFQPAA